MTEAKQTWRFQALDTLFFRESRPMESIGGSELLSAFPPSPRTMAGAVRTAVGEKHGVNWSDWQRWESESKRPEETDPYADLKLRMGAAANYGQLRFNGPWLALEKRSDKAGTQVDRLYPVPHNIVIQRSKKNNQITKIGRLRVGASCDCDLGKKVRLPMLPDGDRNWKSADDYWVSAETLQRMLTGNAMTVPEAGDWFKTSDLFDREARLGIARNNYSRSVEEGLLYQTRHVRPKHISERDSAKDKSYLSTLIEFDVAGLAADDYTADGVVRLGGEGRGATYSVHDAGAVHLPASYWQDKTAEIAKARGVVLVLLAPLEMSARDDGESEYIPLPGFAPCKQDGVSVWKGEINQIALTLHCAIQGKPVREGGWDLVNNCPRPVKSFAPVGSVYYLTVDDGGLSHALEQLHFEQLGADENDLALGRGLVAAGLWPADELMGEGVE